MITMAATLNENKCVLDQQTAGGPLTEETIDSEVSGAEM